MLYVVGGVSRSGKSSLATIMNEEHNVPWLALDALRWGLTIGAPELGIDSNNDDKKDADRLWPILEAIVDNIHFDGRDYLIEGVVPRPEHLKRLEGEYKQDIKTCFLGYPSAQIDQKLDQVMTFDGPNDWLRDKGPEFIRNFIASRIDQSAEDQEQCMALEIAYFDTADDFMGTLQKAKSYLR